MRALMLPLFLGFSLLGCSEMSLSMKGGQEAALDDSDAAGAEEGDSGGAGFAQPSLRLEVTPGDGLLEQSFWLEDVGDEDADGDWEGLVIELQPTINVVGTILGFDANPYSLDPQIPGQAAIPVVAQLSVTQPGSVISASTISDEDGRFLLQVPAGTGYQLAIQPVDPPELPFLVRTNQDFTESQSLNEIDLGYGDPVYGSVKDDQGEPVYAQVRLVHAATGAAGAATATDPDTGFFLLRADPGDYTLRVERLDQYLAPVVPTLEISPLSFESGADGATANVVVGALEPVDVGGYIVDSDGEEQEGATIRFTALDLDQVEEEGFDSVSLVIEDEPGGDGVFETELLPGDWQVEIIPAYTNDTAESHPAPLLQTLRIEPGEDRVEMGMIELPDRVRVEHRVLTSGGEPAAFAGVTFVERGFSRATYFANADEEGRIVMYVPPVPLDLRLDPTNNQDALTRGRVDDPAGLSDSGEWYLVEGELIEGTVTRPDGVQQYANITIYDHAGVEYGATLADENGNFKVRIDTRVLDDDDPEE